MTAQPDTVQRTREEKFRWDEENRLTALSQNGYVSHYWYDADGDRTVKMHGGSMAVFVNSVRDGRMLDMQPSTAYFSPCFSIQGNSFTKHLYIGSERIASMTGTLSPGDVSNSSAGGYNISHAGYNVGVTQLNIPYATKRAAMIDSAEANYVYDLNGNITSLTRKGVRVALAPFDYTYWTYGMIDDLSLTYNGNQLKNATDQSTNVYPYEGLMDFKDGANQRVEYTWDANGNMTSDANKGITRIKYNVLNLPQEITYSDRHIVRYKYAADGRKLQTRYLMSMVPIIIRGEGVEAPSDSDDDLFGGMGLRDPIGGGGISPIDTTFFPAETTLMVRDYCGNHIYRDRVLERINNDYGYWTGGQWYYYIKDYQGNVRAVINHAGVLQEVNNYYPYGALMGGGSVGNNASVQPYKYGTKELDRQNGLDWYDSQARMYDPLLGRTPTMDALAEKYYSISPYAWCAGNPVLYGDFDGQDLYRFDEKNGIFILHKKTNDNHDVIGKFHFDKKTSEYVLQTNKDGTDKIDPRYGRIAKGILKDGINFKDENQLIDVGGELQPTVEDVESFAYSLSESIKTEISGSYFASGGNEFISHVAIGAYGKNHSQEAKNKSYKAWQERFRTNGLKELQGFFHTHPNVLDYLSRKDPSRMDLNNQYIWLREKQSLRFYILTKPQNDNGQYYEKIEY